jgi:hypothetical protein
MKWVHYLFFNIYNWFYKDGMYNRRINPSLQAVSIFAIGTGLWLVLIYDLITHIFNIINVYNNTERLTIGLIAIIIMAFYNFYFISSDRYLRIYDQFKEFSKGNKNRTRDLIISFVILLFPFPIIAFWAFISKFN